jgi:hypothetical protein
MTRLSKRRNTSFWDDCLFGGIVVAVISAGYGVIEGDYYSLIVGTSLAVIGAIIKVNADKRSR